MKDRSWLLVVLLSLAFLLTPCVAHASVVPSVPKPAPFYSVSGDIDEVSARYLRMALGAAKAAGAKEIVIYITSPGGDADESVQMYRDLRASGLRSTCVARGLVASGAAILYLGCDVRLAEGDAQIVIHRPYGLITHPTKVTPEDALQMAMGLGRVAMQIDQIVCERLGMSLADLRTKIGDGRDWELTLPEALAAKVVQRVVASNGS